MSRAEDRVTAALLEHADLPDYTATPPEELLQRLAVGLAERVEAAIELVAIVGALRAQRVGFEVIRDRGGVPVGTASRWTGLYETEVAARSRDRSDARA